LRLVGAVLGRDAGTVSWLRVRQGHGDPDRGIQWQVHRAGAPLCRANTESWRRACPLWAYPPATNGDDEIESAPKLAIVAMLLSALVGRECVCVRNWGFKGFAFAERVYSPTIWVIQL
jgi:hypothetical protein